jgi:hypothetical protein
MSSTQAHQNDPRLGIADSHGKNLGRCSSDPDRIRYWAKVLDVTEAQLRHALNTVGLQWDDLRNEADLRSEAMSARLNKLLFIHRHGPDDTPVAAISAVAPK